MLYTAKAEGLENHVGILEEKLLACKVENDELIQQLEKIR